VYPKAELCYVSIQFGLCEDYIQFSSKFEPIEIFKKDDVDESPLEKALESFDESIKSQSYYLDCRRVELWRWQRIAKSSFLEQFHNIVIIASSASLGIENFSECGSLLFPKEKFDDLLLHECLYDLNSGFSLGLAHPYFFGSPD
jgi:hypothetical protein